MGRKVSDWGGCIAAFIAVLVVNYLSNALPIGGQTPKDVSDKYASLFTPDSFTFAIWGVIYLALAAFVIYQALPAQRKNQLVSKVSKLFIVSCIANIAWIFSWHYEILPLSLVIMLVILVTLILIYRTLGIANRPATLTQYLFLYLPFSLYLGWITVATVANISVVQNALSWDNLGLDAVNWTLLKLAVVGAISAVVVLRHSDVIYGLVIAWAAFGIMSKQVDTPAVMGAAAMLAAFAVILVTYQAVHRMLGR